MTNSDGWLENTYDLVDEINPNPGRYIPDSYGDRYADPRTPAQRIEDAEYKDHQDTIRDLLIGLHPA